MVISGASVGATQVCAATQQADHGDTVRFGHCSSAGVVCVALVGLGRCGRQRVGGASYKPWHSFCVVVSGVLMGTSQARAATQQA